MAHRVKSPPALQETRAQFPGQEATLEKGMVTHSSILTWEIPWTGEPGGLQFMGWQRVRHDWYLLTYVNLEPCPLDRVLLLPGQLSWLFLAFHHSKHRS